MLYKSFSTARFFDLLFMRVSELGCESIKADLLHQPRRPRRGFFPRGSMKKLSLRPYVGQLYITRSVEEYQRKHRHMFGYEDDLGHAAGKFRGRADDNGHWTYLIWAKKMEVPYLAHELSHVILDVFTQCGIDPREANGEPFCYMLGQLLHEAL